MTASSTAVLSQFLPCNTGGVHTCNAEFTDRDAWQVNGQIRHHAIGNNPFVVIITLVWIANDGGARHRPLGRLLVHLVDAVEWEPGIDQTAMSP